MGAPPSSDATISGPPVMPAAEPFVFQGCVQSCELLSHEAHDARELLDQIKHVPAESIFCHTSVLLMHRPPQPDAYPNDFAMWADIELRDRRLTERLAAIDPFRLGSIEGVRAELVSTLEHHAQQLSAAPTRVTGSGAGAAISPNGWTRPSAATSWPSASATSIPMPARWSGSGSGISSR